VGGAAFVMAGGSAAQAPTQLRRQWAWAWAWSCGSASMRPRCGRVLGGEPAPTGRGARSGTASKGRGDRARWRPGAGGRWKRRRAGQALKVTQRTRVVKLHTRLPRVSGLPRGLAGVACTHGAPECVSHVHRGGRGAGHPDRLRGGSKRAAPGAGHRLSGRGDAQEAREGQTHPYRSPGAELEASLPSGSGGKAGTRTTKTRPRSQPLGGAAARRRPRRRKRRRRRRRRRAPRTGARHGLPEPAQGGPGGMEVLRGALLANAVP
jgi:hypothetical protein